MLPPPFQPEPHILALGVRQPWAELILRGVKTLEVRSRKTQIRGAIYLYASRQSSNLLAAREAASRQGVDVARLPRGMIVGSVEICGCRPAEPTDAAAAQVAAELLWEQQVWHLTNPVRFEPPVPISMPPYGIWFYPFRGPSPGACRDELPAAALSEANAACRLSPVTLVPWQQPASVDT